MRTYLLFITLSFSLFGFAQYTAIPDANFENALSAYDDIPNDGQVPTANINTITSLDVNTQNIADLTGIEDFVALQILYCKFNNLNSLDVSNNSSLIELYCSYNYILTSLMLGSNTTLAIVDCSVNTISSLDISNNTSLLQLICNDNQLTSLDTTQNLVLQNLRCYNNLISSIDLQFNQQLTSLIIGGNNLTSLDVSNNLQLIAFNCGTNYITSLDLSLNTLLTHMRCDNNSLTYFNIKNGNNTNITDANFAVSSGNSNLQCLEVDNPTWSIANWTQIPSGANFSLNCTNPETYVPDDNFENYLETHDANGVVVAMGAATSMGNGVMDDYVTTANINTVTVLSINGKGIAYLTGIEDFLLLEELYVGSNNLATVDLSNNTALIKLEIYNNQLTTIDVSALNLLEVFHIALNNLTAIDVSNNPNLGLFRCQANNISVVDVSLNPLLYQLYVNENSLSSLDVSLNPVLNRLYCYNNNLTSLNVKNGNNTNFIAFNSTSNPNLLCIEVDSPIYSNANWPNIDPASSFNHNCASPETYVPDNNFENYLETHNSSGGVVALGAATSMGNGIANDNYVTTNSINTVINLNISNKNISDLTGIADFIALKYFNCYSNQLVNIDASQNSDLISIICFGNQITSLDLSQNLLIETVDCRSNQITDLDLSLNTNLNSLNCNNNLLTSLNVKNGNNTNLPGYNFLSQNNPNLTCVIVDNAAYSVANWANIDATSTFVNNQAECSALSIDSYQKDIFSFYPNPSSNYIDITIHQNAIYSLYTLNGQLLKVGKLESGINKLSLKQYSHGVYFIKVQTENQITSKKLIIN